jgi:hypothetical protein
VLTLEVDSCPDKFLDLWKISEKLIKSVIDVLRLWLISGSGFHGGCGLTLTVLEYKGLIDHE